MYCHYLANTLSYYKLNVIDHCAKPVKNIPDYRQTCCIPNTQMDGWTDATKHILSPCYVVDSYTFTVFVKLC